MQGTVETRIPYLNVSEKQNLALYWFKCNAAC